MYGFADCDMEKEETPSLGRASLLTARLKCPSSRICNYDPHASYPRFIIVPLVEDPLDAYFGATLNLRGIATTSADYLDQKEKRWSKEDCDKLSQRIGDAKLSRAAYDGKAPKGWRLGETYSDAKSGFKAREFFSNTGERVIAFAGTEAEWGDIRADAQQAVGNPLNSQYVFANEIGRADSNS